MKKWMFAAIGGSFILLAVLFLLATSMGGGAMGTISSPLLAFATPEQAYQYQYIGSELGVPWDITMLADGIHAYDHGEKDLANYDPLMTALQFCILQEQKYEKIEIEPEKPDNTPMPDQGAAPAGQAPQSTPEPEPDPEPEIRWELKETFLYTGFDEILNYMGKDSDSFKFSYEDVNAFITAINKIAEEKTAQTGGQYRYEVTLLNNPDYKKVLREFIVLTEDDIDYAMEVYDTKYLCLLYGYDSTDFSLLEPQIPDLVTGNVTRQQLAQVAVSLLGHPYWLGGKSSHEGAPDGPLDCSGFVDWVYVQCFGVTIGNGGSSLPKGLAVSGTGIQWYATDPIEQTDLQVGDLGFLRDPADVKNGQYNHVGIYLGNVDGKDYWIHCGGSSYGTAESPTGRVGISVSSGTNSYNPVDGSFFSPAMKSVKFNYFRRPRFEFIGE